MKKEECETCGHLDYQDRYEDENGYDCIKPCETCGHLDCQDRESDFHGCECIDCQAEVVADYIDSLLSDGVVL